MNRNILIMKQKTLLLVFACFLFLASGCSFFSAEGPKDTIKIYTTLDKKFVETLCDAYSKGLPADQKLAFAVTDKDAEESQADCILGSVSLLRQKAAEGSLQKLQADCADLLPDVLKDWEERWTVLFYDPAVLLVNHEYSRKAGQQQILHWYDLPKQKDAKIVVENLSDNESTVAFLTAMSSRMGQNEFMDYFKQLRPLIRQFAKFPITPVRMAATGDADIAVTRRSHVFKYLQNDFPAYILVPEEGTPVNLYGVGILKQSKRQKEMAAFINWILQSPEVRAVLMTTRSGFLPVLPRGEKGQAADMDKLWLNTFYKEEKAVEKLTRDWLEEIRLADSGE